MNLADYEKFLLFALAEDLLDEDDTLTRTSQVSIPYKHYPRFNLDDLREDECLARFRF